MKKYPSYKESGLAWLSKIPSHWEIKKLKYVADHVLRGDSPVYTDKSRVKVVNQACVHKMELRLENLKYHVECDIEGFKGKLRSNDLLVNSTGTGTLGRSCLFDLPDADDYIADGHVTVVRDSKGRFNPYFLQCFFSTNQDLITAYASEGATNQIELQRENFRSLKLPYPPLPEQEAIAEYIKAKSKQIDAFIKSKQRLIALLQEQKAGIISKAVTQGLNPNARLKPSSIEWLGDVPEHWESQRAKFYFYEVDERSVSGQEELLSVSHITGVTPRSEKNITMFMAESYEGYKTCRRGDLVINIMWAWMGALGVSGYDGIVSSAYGVYRQRDKNNFYGPYLDYLLRTKGYVAEFTCRSKGVTSSRARMYTDDFFDVHIVRPPYEEQVEIVRHIKQESGTIDKAIAKANQEIELIQEFRTTLISDAVTGKIDVRKAETVGTVSAPAEIVPFPLPQKEPARREAPPAFKRAVLGAEIVHQLRGEMTFGKWKLQKLLYFCEHHVKLQGLESNYIRDAAGPHDNRMMRSALSQMETSEWYRFDESGRYGEKFVPLSKAGGHREYFERYWGERRESIQYVIDLFRKEKTDWCQMVATLYAAWNDFLLEGRFISDDAIVKEVLSDWHPSKREIPEQVWRKALSWMRELNFVPSGFGRPTQFKKQSKPRNK